MIWSGVGWGVVTLKYAVTDPVLAHPKPWSTLLDAKQLVWINTLDQLLGFYNKNQNVLISTSPPTGTYLLVFVAIGTSHWSVIPKSALIWESVSCNNNDKQLFYIHITPLYVEK